MHATLQEEIFFFLSFPKGVILLCMNSLREYIMKEKKKKKGGGEGMCYSICNYKTIGLILLSRILMDILLWTESPVQDQALCYVRTL